jgi:hypothetical protein
MPRNDVRLPSWDALPDWDDESSVSRYEDEEEDGLPEIEEIATGTHRSGGRVEAPRSPVHGTSLTGAGDNDGTARPITLSRFKRVIRGVTKPRPAAPRPAIPAAGYEMTIEQVRDACGTGLMVEVRETDWGVTKGERGMIFNRLPGDRWEVLLDRGDIWTLETKEIYPVFDET